MKPSIFVCGIVAFLLITIGLATTRMAKAQNWNDSNQTLPQKPAAKSIVKSNQPTPLAASIKQAGLWQVFTITVSAGIKHIKDSTDHLLFLLALLLPLPLVAVNKRWAGPGTTKYAVKRMVNVFVAFAIGHSVTFFTGAAGLLHYQPQMVALLIAGSILVASVHALKPIFAGKEIYFAAVFGLIHGMAFADLLTNPALDAGRMAFSIWGFNLGITLMQLLIIAVTTPWLIILSRTNFYTTIRLAGAIFACIAALAWIAERGTQNPNFITDFVAGAAIHTKWVILFLAALAVFNVLSKNRSSFTHAKEWQ